MRKTFNTKALVSEAGGAIGGKVRDASVAGEMYLDGNEADFLNPIGKTFTVAGKIIKIEKQEAIDLLKKYKMYDKVIGVEVGGIKVSVGNGMEIRGVWENDKIEVAYSAVLGDQMECMKGVKVTIGVKGFFNSMAINNVVVVGTAAV